MERDVQKYNDSYRELRNGRTESERKRLQAMGRATTERGKAPRLDEDVMLLGVPATYRKRTISEQIRTIKVLEDRLTSQRGQRVHKEVESSDQEKRIDAVEEGLISLSKRCDNQTEMIVTLMGKESARNRQFVDEAKSSIRKEEEFESLTRRVLEQKRIITNLKAKRAQTVAL